MRSSVIGNILKQNPKVTTHTGNKPPYGYLDWWPNSLWVNTQLAPYSDAKVRHAMSLAIDRDKLNDMVYEGAKVSTIYPFPLYPNLVKFAELPAMKALVDKYQPAKFDLTESVKLMTESGFQELGGLWTLDGKTVDATIQGFEASIAISSRSGRDVVPGWLRGNVNSAPMPTTTWRWQAGLVHVRSWRQPD
jgi:peptide/nickel transport system substrate-binding protein